MTSRVWPAHTGHSAADPQLCGLSVLQISKGDHCLYLTCAGEDASPQHQIKEVGEEEYQWRGRQKTRKVQETPDGTRFRSVPTGRFRCKRRTCGEEFDRWRKWCHCKGKVQAIFKWQEGRPVLDDDGEQEFDSMGNPKYRWHDVKVWEKVVLAAVADRLGYDVPKLANGEFRMTQAFEGSRNIGTAHSVEDTPESQLMDLARAAMSPEELGEAPPIEPTPEPEPEGIGRFLKLDLDSVPERKDEAPTPGGEIDPGVARFLRLDLD